MGDDRLPLLLEQLNQALLLGDQGVNLGGFVVEEGGYRCLFFLLGRPGGSMCRVGVLRQPDSGQAIGTHSHKRLRVNGVEESLRMPHEQPLLGRTIDKW